MPEIFFLINKSEIGAGTRGASLGPEAILTAAAGNPDPLFAKYPLKFMKDNNFSLFRENKYINGIRIDYFFEQLSSVSREISQLLTNGKLPVVLAGDHGSAAGTIAGIRNSNLWKRTGVIWIDAHADLHSPYTSPSGNMHGMPLAIALSADHKEITLNKPLEKTVDYWEKLKSLAIAPFLKNEDVVFIGVRSLEKAENIYITKNNLKTFTVEDCRKLGIESTIRQTLDYLKACDSLYISFDVDSMDPDLVSYGTGTTVKNGFSGSEAMEIISGFCKDPRLVALEIVEVNPCLDNKCNLMAEVTYNILRKSITSIENHHL